MRHQELLAAVLASLASLSWAIAPIIGAPAARSLGAFHFARYRASIAVLVVALMTALSGQYSSLSWHSLPYLISSSIVGIAIGDYLLFVALKILGPRRCTVLYASHVPLTAALAYLWLDETLSRWQLLGFALAFMGIIMALACRQANAADEHTEQSFKGILAGLAAAVCQAIGVILAKPAFSYGVGPLAASTVRIATAAVILNAVAGRSLFTPMGRSDARRIAISGLIGTGLGSTCSTAALSLAKVSIAGIFSSLSPLFMLPLLPLSGAPRPQALAWLGAAITVGGLWLLVI